MNLELLNKLTQAFGPSGYEEEIRDLIQKEIAPFVDEVWVDPLGSLIAHRHGKGKKLIVNAHIDEIGVMVMHIDEQGFLRFAPVGGLSPLICAGARVRFANGTVGAVMREHREDTSTAPTLEQLYIDVGAAGKSDGPVNVGDPAVFIGPLAHQGQRITSKALDDRIGCYILIETLRQLEAPDYDLYALFSTQEEVTHAGARTSAFKIAPDIALALDVTPTGDTPKAVPNDLALAQGPAIKVQDSRLIAHPAVRELLRSAAQKAHVPYQLEVLRRGTTDAAVMQLVRDGVPSGCLSIPCRFVHTPSEMVDSRDVENAIRLCRTLIQSAPQEEDTAAC